MECEMKNRRCLSSTIYTIKDTYRTLFILQVDMRIEKEKKIQQFRNITLAKNFKNYETRNALENSHR